MPNDDIERSHSHLPQRSLQEPKAPRKGIFSFLFGFLRKRDMETKWKPNADISENWTSARGSFDPSLPYTAGKPQKKAKPETNPLENRNSNEIDPEIASTLQKRFANIISLESRQIPAFKTTPEDLLEVLTFLKDERTLNFSWPQHMTAIDWPDKNQLELVYVLRNISSKEGKAISIHIFTDRHKARVPSSAKIFSGFNWHEREVYELYGVEFIDHPDLRKLLLDSTYQGFPMLKGYKDDEHEFIQKPY
jgi:NADH-quinone oxidoreductase subunit C